MGSWVGGGERDYGWGVGLVVVREIMDGELGWWG